MNWTILLIFAIVLGVYFIGLIGFVIVKAVMNKKKVQKEIEESKEKKDEEITTRYY